MVVANESRIGKCYRMVYAALCGKHPNERPWHFQWLTTRVHGCQLRCVLASLSGRVLDVGCGVKPYRNWFKRVTHYVGLDVELGPGVDVVVRPGEPWQLPDGNFDVVLCTQVLEHVADLEQFQQELLRMVAPGGVLVATVPFLYNVHGAPHDYRRFTLAGLAGLMPAEFEIVRVQEIGGIGSTIGILFLNWVDAALSRNTVTRAVKGLALPLWMVLSAVVNVTAILMDRLDCTRAFYSNTLLVARRK